MIIIKEFESLVNFDLVKELGQCLIELNHDGPVYIWVNYNGRIYRCNMLGQLQKDLQNKSEYSTLTINVSDKSIEDRFAERLGELAAAGELDDLDKC